MSFTSFATARALRVGLGAALMALSSVTWLTPVAAQPPQPGPVPNEAATPEPDASTRGVRPFGANLFAGSYAAQREDGLNPEYEILPGDRVMVNAWGAVTVNDIFPVDTQGNIFLPSVGPVRLAGVPTPQLTDVVRAAIRRVYRGDFGVYTNLLTASPVAVFVTGGVPRPGRYAGIPNDSILFFLDQAGGIEAQSGSYREVRVIRQGQEIASADLYDFLLEGTIDTPQFQDGDTILVGRRGPSVDVIRPELPPVSVELLPGEDMTGAQVLRVVSEGARVTAVTLRGMREGHSTARTMTVSALGATGLRNGDILTFREDIQPDFIVVHLEGEFQGPSALAVRRGARLLDLLNFVPVDPELSRTDAVFVRRDRIRQEQRQALHDSLDRLERTTMLALSDTNSEANIRVQEAELVRAFVERARTIQPLGVMVTSSAGRQLNVLLQDGDTVVIPPATNVVHVVGEVQIPSAVMYRPDLTVHDYVGMAGGPSLRAGGNVLIRRVNAEIVTGDWNTPVYPGDQVMIPPVVDDKWAQNGIDLAQVVYQIAVAAAVVLRPI